MWMRDRNREASVMRDRRIRDDGGGMRDEG